MGLAELEKSLTQPKSYVGILNESVRISNEKALLMLGAEQSEQPCRRCKPLSFDDVDVLGVEVAQSWKAEEVAGFLDRYPQSKTLRSLDYVICDGGSNLNKALQAKGITAVSDCSHVFMNLIKKLPKDNQALSCLIKFIGKYRQRHVMSPCSPLCLPTLRDKDRFSRLFQVVSWINRLDTYRDQMSSEQRGSIRYLKTPNVQNLVRELRQLRDLVALASTNIKARGISKASQARWQKDVKEYRKRSSLTPRAQSLVRCTHDYIKEQMAKLDGREYLLCCSDIVKSMFGRYKNKGGMKVIRSDVLYLALMGKPIRAESVTKALSRVSQKHLNGWHQQNTCLTRNSRLRALKERTKQATRRA